MKEYIDSDIPYLRDPYLLEYDGAYYLYGTGWVCYKNADRRLSGGWEPLGVVVSLPEGHECDDNRWAPEVHVYQGKFYMFTTYHSAKTGHRGCAIFAADDPAGPFTEITGGQITPHDWDAIDGTLYVDEQRQPWMVFVHEWTSTDDGIGRMAAAKLSPDFTRFVSAPIELFRADDPRWANGPVTDGCFMYRTQTGSLLMTWSNFGEPGGYTVGIARSDNGRLDGRWIQEDTPLYDRTISGVYDGGHGMLFRHTDGRLYMTLHAPNTPVGDRLESPIFIPIREQNDTLVWERGASV